MDLQIMKISVKFLAIIGGFFFAIYILIMNKDNLHIRVREYRVNHRDHNVGEGQTLGSQSAQQHHDGPRGQFLPLRGTQVGSTICNVPEKCSNAKVKSQGHMPLHCYSSHVEIEFT